MNVTTEPDIWRRLDNALDEKVRLVFREWMAQGSPGLLRLDGPVIYQVRVNGRVSIPGAIWN